MNAKMAIEDRVIGARFGVGTITSIDEMGGNEFYIISPDESTLRVMVPCTAKKQIRQLTPASKLTSKLQTLSTKINLDQFDSKKDMIAHYKELAKGCSLDETINAIGQLTKQPNKGAMEQKLLKTMIDSLSLEVATVLDQNIDNARKSILARLDNE